MTKHYVSVPLANDDTRTVRATLAYGRVEVEAARDGAAVQFESFTSEESGIRDMDTLAGYVRTIAAQWEYNLRAWNDDRAWRA